MFALIHFQENKEVKRKIYHTLTEAQNNIFDKSIGFNHYKIYDADKMDIVEEDAIEPLNFEDTIDMMYPNNENGDDF